MEDKDKFWLCASSFYRVRNEKRPLVRSGKASAIHTPHHKRCCQMVRYYLTKIRALRGIK